MPLTITDEHLRAMGLSEKEAKTEFACRMFDAGRMTIGHACLFAGISEEQFELELVRREIPRHRYTEDMAALDVRTAMELRGNLQREHGEQL